MPTKLPRARRAGEPLPELSMVQTVELANNLPAALPPLQGYPCCQCGTTTDGTSEFCSHECSDRYYHG